MLFHVPRKWAQFKPRLLWMLGYLETLSTCGSEGEEQQLAYKCQKCETG